MARSNGFRKYKTTYSTPGPPHLFRLKRTRVCRVCPPPCGAPGTRGLVAPLRKYTAPSRRDEDNVNWRKRSRSPISTLLRVRSAWKPAVTSWMAGHQPWTHGAAQHWLDNPLRKAIVANSNHARRALAHTWNGRNAGTCPRCGLVSLANPPPPHNTSREISRRRRALLP